MAKSVNLYVRIEPELKEQAESILNALGMTAAQFDAELEKGYADMRAGRTIPAKQVFADIRKGYGV